MCQFFLLGQTAWSMSWWNKPGLWLRGALGRGRTRGLQLYIEKIKRCEKCVWSFCTDDSVALSTKLVDTGCMAVAHVICRSHWLFSHSCNTFFRGVSSKLRRPWFGVADRHGSRLFWHSLSQLVSSFGDFSHAEKESLLVCHQSGTLPKTAPWIWSVHAA